MRTAAELHGADDGGAVWAARCATWPPSHRRLLHTMSSSAASACSRLRVAAAASGHATMRPLAEWPSGILVGNGIELGAFGRPIKSCGHDCNTLWCGVRCCSRTALSTVDKALTLKRLFCYQAYHRGETGSPRSTPPLSPPNPVMAGYIAFLNSESLQAHTILFMAYLGLTTQL